jgi:hypothetical protein
MDVTERTHLLKIQSARAWFESSRVGPPLALCGPSDLSYFGAAVSAISDIGARYRARRLIDRTPLALPANEVGPLRFRREGQMAGDQIKLSAQSRERHGSR